VSQRTVEHYLYASHEDSPVGRALAIHYPATNGEAPSTCAVCYFWPGSPFRDVVAEPWPCPTVRALMPGPHEGG
jgi:hypothetical protein